MDARLGGRASRRSTPPMRTAAAAASRASADWLRTKGSEVRDEIVLSTKTFNPMDDGADHGLAPERIKRQLESSLQPARRRARADVPRRTTGIPTSRSPRPLGALDELVAAGKVGAYGASNVDGAQLPRGAARPRALRLGAELVLAARPRGRARGAAALRGARARLHAVQPARRRLAHRQVPRAASRRPQARAMTMRPGAVRGVPHRPRLHRARAPRRARRAGASSRFAWLFAEPRVTAVVVGPRRAEHLEPALAALRHPVGRGHQAGADALCSTHDRPVRARGGGRHGAPRPAAAGPRRGGLPHRGSRRDRRRAARARRHRAAGS